LANCCFGLETNLHPSVLEGQNKSRFLKTINAQGWLSQWGNRWGDTKRVKTWLWIIFICSTSFSPFLLLFLSLSYLVLKNTLSFTHGQLISHSFSYSLQHTHSLSLSLTHTHTQSSFKTVPHFNNLSEKWFSGSKATSC